jgi:hypothetical protein
LCGGCASEGTFVIIDFIATSTAKGKTMCVIQACHTLVTLHHYNLKVTLLFHIVFVVCG